MKYIIKNCPACILDPSCCAQWHINNGNAKDCSDITDCVMKRIVAECKLGVSEADFGFLLSKINNPNWIAVGNPVSYAILRLLEIEEVDE